MFFVNYFLFRFSNYISKISRIGGVRLGALVSSTVDRGFELRSGKTTDYKIGTCCFSAKHAPIRRKSKDCLARNQDKNPTQCVGLVQSEPHHHLIEN